MRWSPPASLILRQPRHRIAPDGIVSAHLHQPPARAKTLAAEPRVSSAAVKAASAPRTAQGKAASAAVSARKAVTVRKRTATTVAHTATPAGEQATGWRRFHGKTKVGVVISAKQPKTVIVTVGRMREHPLYKKVIRLRKGFAAHDDARPEEIMISGPLGDDAHRVHELD